MQITKSCFPERVLVDNRKKRIFQGQKAVFVGRGTVKVTMVGEVVTGEEEGAGRWSIVH